MNNLSDQENIEIDLSTIKLNELASSNHGIHILLSDHRSDNNSKTKFYYEDSSK